VDQRLRVLDPANTGHQPKDMGQEEIGRMIGSVMVTRPAYVELEEMAEAQRFAKLLKKAQSTEPGEPRSLEGKMEFSPSFGHASQMYQNGSFVRKPFYPREMAFS
jgi:hypothetical protein